MPRTAIPAFVIAYSDSDFTNPHEVVLSAEPADYRGKHTHMGAQYWGLETARHRATSINADGASFNYDHDAHNSITIGLKVRSRVDQITISTKWFTGNQVPAFSVTLYDELTDKVTVCLPRTPLNPDAHHSFKFKAIDTTECRMKLYAEGGISRINLFGKPSKQRLPERENLLKNATISHVSNEHYGNPQMVVDGDREEMFMRGWESARTGFGERALFQLAYPTFVSELIVDTYLHRLNAPLSCHVFGLNLPANAEIDDYMLEAPRWMLRFADGHEVVPDSFQDYMLEQRYLLENTTDPKRFQIALQYDPDSPWQTLLLFEPLKPDTWHRFRNFESSNAITHLLYTHYPNGGIHGLKLFGHEVS